jgi:hypothetical protein
MHASEGVSTYYGCTHIHIKQLCNIYTKQILHNQKLIKHNCDPVLIIVRERNMA